MRKIFFSLVVCVSVLGMAELVAQMFVVPEGAMVQVHSGTHERSQWLEERNGSVAAAYQHRTTGGFSKQHFHKRIAVLGGSSVHGGTNNLSDKQEFSALLGKSLGVEAINLGNPSLDSHDILAILEELQQYKMDAWVVYTGHNDFGNTYFHQRYKGWSGTMGAYAYVWMSRRALYRLLQRFVQIPNGNTALPNPQKQFSGPQISKGQKIRALSYFQDNIEKMIWLAQQNNTPIIFIVPMRDLLRAPLGDCREEPCSLDLYDQGIALRSTNSQEAVNLLAQASDADGIPLRVLSSAQEYLRSVSQKGVFVIDAPTLLKGGDGIVPSEYFQDHVHLSQKGHQQLASVLAPFLKPIVMDAQ